MEVNDGNNLQGEDDLPAVASRLHALELHALSAEDRNMIQEEMHGVRSQAVQETPTLVAQSIQQMLLHVEQKIPPEERQAYTVGMDRSEASRRFITRPNFLLQFLRAERYDPELAAFRYCRWLQLLLEYFDAALLERDLYLSDLTREEHKFLRDGFIQLLPHRDRCGRRVPVIVGSIGKSYTVTTRVSVVA